MTASNHSGIAGILLAAGGSSRMGRPKQLVQFEEKTLLRRAAETLCSSNCGPVVVVLGAEIDGSKAEISDLDLSVSINENWRDGMSSSIRAGLDKALRIDPELYAVMITLCDQPFVTAQIIDQFLARFRDSKPDIVAAEYSGTRGVPALFSSAVFPDLRRLTGDKGARDLIRCSSNVIPIELDEAKIDIDTSDNLEYL